MKDNLEYSKIQFKMGKCPVIKLLQGITATGKTKNLIAGKKKMKENLIAAFTLSVS